MHLKLLCSPCTANYSVSHPTHHHPESLLPVWLHILSSASLSVALAPRLIWRHLLTSTRPSSHPLTIRVSCVIGSSTIHLIHLIKSQQSKFLGTPPLTSMVTLPLLTQSSCLPLSWVYLFPESQCFSMWLFLLKHYQPYSPQTVSANPPESTSPSASSTTARSTSSHSQVPEFQFLEWGDIFSCFSSSSEELRSLKFILKQQALGRDVKRHQLSQSWQKWGKVGGWTVKMIGLCDLILEWQAIRDTAGTLRSLLRNSWTLNRWGQLRKKCAAILNQRQVRSFLRTSVQKSQP